MIHFELIFIFDMGPTFIPPPIRMADSVPLTEKTLLNYSYAFVKSGYCLISESDWGSHLLQGPICLSLCQYRTVLII